MTDPTSTLLLKNIDAPVTMDPDRRVLQDAWVLAQSNFIAAIGAAGEPLRARSHHLNLAAGGEVGWRLARDGNPAGSAGPVLYSGLAGRARRWPNPSPYI